MKKWASIIPLLMVALVFVGLGGRGVEEFKSIPVPEKNYTVKVVDRTGTEVMVSLFSWEGQVYFGGFKGDGAFTVSFDKVSRVEFGEKNNDGKVKVRFYLKDGRIF